MAKKSTIAKAKKRLKQVALGLTRRARVKESVRTAESFDELQASVSKLQAMPRNESPIRVRRRCACCGRPRGVYRRFQLCRMCLRKALMKGDVPGARKASW